MRQYTFLFLIIVAMLSSCKKDDDAATGSNSGTPNPETSYDNPQLSGAKSSANFFGRITNQNGDIIEGALVEIGNKNTSTNAFGFFEINNVIVDQDYAVIEVTAPSYFKQFRSFNPKESGTNIHDIQLIPLSFTGSFEANTGGSVTVPGGGQIVFQAGELTSADGSAYNGQVVVASTYLNPTDPSMPSYIPGSLLAVDTDGELATMITYGMYGVELYTSNGQPLQLAENSTASLEMPIQAEQMSHAPESIPLWFFDETNGIWREDGFATKVGDKYVGEVSHFTFWNCDVPADWAYLEGTVTFNGEANNQDFYIKVVRANGSSASSSVYNDGSFNGAVPANESLDVYIVDTECFTEEYYSTIPAITTGQTYNMGEIEVSEVNTEISTFTAEVVDCDGNPLSGYVVDIHINNVNLYATSDAEGVIDFILPCQSGNSATVTYNIINMDEALQSIQAEIVLSSIGANNDLGELPYCGETQAVGQYLTYTEGSNSTTMTILNTFQSQGSLLYLYGFADNNESDSIDIANFIVNSLPAPGLGDTDLNSDTGNEHYLVFQLDNGNYYKAVFDETQTEVYMNSAQFSPSNSFVPEKFDLTISGSVQVYIYSTGDTSMPPIDQYTANATCEYYYWPE